MKKILLAGLLAVTMPALQAETSSPANASAASAANSPMATASVADTSSVELAQAKIQDDFSVFVKAYRSNDPMQAKLAESLYAEMNDFCVKHPGHSVAPRIFAVSIQVGDIMNSNHWPGAPTQDELAKKMESLDVKHRVEIRFSELAESLKSAERAPEDGAKWDVVDAQTDRFDQEFGADYKPEGMPPLMLRIREAELTSLATVPDHVRYDILLKKLSASSNPPLADLANTIIKRQQLLETLKSRPLDLKYASIDGRMVDLAQMRGKVVLVDFWATWCGPCVGEVPNVVAAYKKYHDQGFEVVGVSLDQDKDRLLAFTREHEMAWPQYFDGKGWENAISKSCGIDGIPAMWLIGKDGKVITTNAREDLAGQIEKALKMNVAFSLDDKPEQIVLRK